MYYNRLRSAFTLLLIVGSLSIVGVRSASAQSNDGLDDKINGVSERVTTLEATVDGLTKLKVSGYIQPQWVWSDIDSLQNQIGTRNYFQIRRGRIKFQHTIGNVSYLLYPDITETGVVLKEIIAGWKPMKGFEITLGSMNRPFGYEIAYSSSSREVAERSQAENRLFNGERDLGLQFAVNPTFGSLRPLLEIGLYNGSDNFGKGPVSDQPGSSNQLAFSFSQFVGSGGAKSLAPGADSAFNVMVNKGLAQDSLISANSSDGGSLGYKVNSKELLGHIRLPFLISDDFSFDVGGSWSVGGIAEPTNVIGKYTGTNGALVLDASGKEGGSSFNAKSGSQTSGGIFESNRTIFGADAQFYLSVLPIGGTILKGEMYSGQQPFYGSSALFTHADSAAIGAPRPSTIYKKVMGFYGMLVQNITDDFQLAVRYDVFDPNTDVKGTDFAYVVAGQTDDTKSAYVGGLRGINGSSKAGGTLGTGFGGDLKLSTLSIAFNTFVSGALRLMLNWDHPITEDYTRVVSYTGADTKTHFTVQTVTDQHDDRFTFRMQYKF